MTKKLEELFDLAQPEPEEPPSDFKPADANKLKTVLNDVDKIDSALPLVRDLESNDTEMDTIAEKSMSTFNDLMDLGMNVEARYAGKIFEVAGTMMKNAIDARSAKVDKKLRMVELQIKKQRVDQQEQSAGGPLEIEAEATIVADRNELIRQILDKGKDNADKKQHN